MCVCVCCAFLAFGCVVCVLPSCVPSYVPVQTWWHEVSNEADECLLLLLLLFAWFALLVFARDYLMCCHVGMAQDTGTACTERTSASDTHTSGCRGCVVLGW